MASAAAPPAKQKFDAMVKIVMCGDSGVGKTNLIARYTKNEFLEDSQSTIGAEFSSRLVELEDGTVVKVMVWDTAGQERYRAVTRTYYRDALGVVLVYSSTSKKSFKHLDRWVQEVEENAAKQPVLALLGNKADVAESKKKVDAALGREFARARPDTFACFYEASAKTGSNVELAYTELVQEILRRKPELLKKDGAAAGAAPAAGGSRGARGGTVNLDDKDDKEKKKGGCC